MPQKATALIKFKHCDFGEHYADAQAAYDSDPQTAWLAPFTIAQRAYWIQQGGGLINGYAEAYAASRSNSINNSAQSTYATCLAGGASSSPASVVDPGFKLMVQTRLDGDSSSGAVTSASIGPSTQLSVPFRPEPAQDQALDWRAFYRVGAIQLNYNYAENWVMSYPAGGGYPLPAYTELLMRPTVNVEATNLVSVSADLVQYIDVPQGKTITLPEDLAADFTALYSTFTFTLQRRVVLPDGQVIQEEFEYDNGFQAGELSDVHATVALPGLNAGCGVGGTVDVYHFITAYSLGTLYKLSDKIQQVRVDGVDSDFTVPANASGSVPPSYGPPGFNYIRESFNYTPDILGHLFIDSAWDSQSTNIYRVVFKLVNYLTADIGVVVNFSTIPYPGTEHKAWVRLPAASNVGGAIVPSTKYYSCVVINPIPGAFYVQITHPNTPVTTPGDLAEKAVTDTGNIKTYSIINEYEYPGTIGFTPLSKSSGGYVDGLHAFPNLPIGYFTVDDPDEYSNFISPFLVVTYLNPGSMVIRFRASGTLSNGASWLNADHYIYNSGTYYLGIQGNVFTGILEELEVTDHVLIDITDIYRHTGKLWVDKFYSPAGEVIDESRMRNLFHARCAMAVAVQPDDLQVPYFTSISVGNQVRFGTYLSPSKLKTSNFAEVSDISPSNAGVSPDNRIKYYF